MMFIDPLGLWSVVFGGSLMGIDFSTTVYDSKSGWFPSTKPNIGVSTTAVGAGIQIGFDTPVISRTSPDDDVMVSLGISKYTGVSYNTELSRASVNIGLGLGLPVTLGTSVENFAVGLGKGLERLFSGGSREVRYSSGVSGK